MEKINKKLPSKYNSNLVEKNRYNWWKENGFFDANLKSKKPPFTVIMPPPNVTGKLHIGHAWDDSLQDAIIRFKKLNGFDTLYLPGTDHAGIATQAKVEAHLKTKNINRWDLGREKFLVETWKWKEEYAKTIHQQWAKLGLALDYNLENFTLNPEINNLVNFVFVQLYEKGLIYRGKRIVNWDPEQKTAISNIEVIYRETIGEMYYFKYQLVNSTKSLVVATTRPETMFGDQAIVVNPHDKRYSKFIGQKVINPVNETIIPVLADDYVDQDFGTGVMKVTPAHDVNDFEIGLRHSLAQMICLNEDGTVNQLGGSAYQGLDRFEARKKIVSQAKKNKTLAKIEKIEHQVGYSERSNAVIEPYLSNQWFVQMKPLAKLVLDLQKSKKAIDFFPPRFNQVLEGWMQSTLDWTISRQLWWGHQIPAWYHNQTKEIYVGLTPPKDTENWTQDPDVLDTWFSSALWPFATLKWEPTKKSPLFQRYYPTNVLVTGYDIIFFWVARMIFQSWEFTHQKPFNDVLIHGLVRDEKGQKMSKSLGNGIDPMEIIEKYGVDALRFFLLTNSTPGQDIKYSEEKIRNAWNFMNKLWNAARYVLLNLPSNFKFNEQKMINKNFENNINQWILTELTFTMNNVWKQMEQYEFGLAGKEIYDFVWNKYCSWFIEFAKVNLESTNLEIIESTQQTLFYVLKNILIMLHPYAPFLTEAIYQELHLKKSIMLEDWTKHNFHFQTEYLNVVVDLITTIREFRNKNKISNKTPLTFYLNNLSETKNKLFEKYLVLINEFIKVFVNAAIKKETLSQEEINSIPVTDFFLEIANDQFIDQKIMIDKLKKSYQELLLEVKRSEKILGNKSFLQKADAKKVALEKEKYKLYQSKLKNIKLKIQKLEKK